MPTGLNNVGKLNVLYYYTSFRIHLESVSPPPISSNFVEVLTCELPLRDGHGAHGSFAQQPHVFPSGSDLLVSDVFLIVLGSDLDSLLKVSTNVQLDRSFDNQSCN